MDSAQRDRLAGLTQEGGATEFPRYEVPMLRFNGNTGEFKKIISVPKGDDIEEAVTKPVELVVLRKKSSLSAFKTKESWFSSEFTSPNDTIALFHQISGKTTFLKTAPVSQIREEFQLLKTQLNLYCLFNGEVVKLGVKGGSLANYFDYQNKLKEDDKHGFEVTTSIGSQKAKNEELGTTYYKMTFDAKPLAVEGDVIEAKVNEVNAALKRIDDYQASRAASAPAQTRTQVDKEFDEMGTQVSPDDIPF